MPSNVASNASNLRDIGIVNIAGEIHLVVVLESEGPAAECLPEMMHVGVEVEGIWAISLQTGTRHP